MTLFFTPSAQRSHYCIMGAAFPPPLLASSGVNASVVKRSVARGTDSNGRVLAKGWPCVIESKPLSGRYDEVRVWEAMRGERWRLQPPRSPGASATAKGSAGVSVHGGVCEQRGKLVDVDASHHFRLPKGVLIPKARES